MLGRRVVPLARQQLDDVEATRKREIFPALYAFPGAERTMSMDWTLPRQVVSQEMLSGLSESIGEMKPPFEQAVSWARLASLCATCKRIEEKSGTRM